MMLTPAMQGVILAIAKARQIFDTEGPEAGLIKVRGFFRLLFSSINSKLQQIQFGLTLITV